MRRETRWENRTAGPQFGERPVRRSRSAKERAVKRQSGKGQSARRRTAASAWALSLCLGASVLGGCSYASSAELRSQAESQAAASQAGDGQTAGGAGAGSQGSGNQAIGAANAGTGAQGEGALSIGSAMETPQAQTEAVEVTRTQAAPMPTFEDASDTVYVKTGGGSVRVRSSCDTSSDENILGNVSYGTELSRTGKNSEWTRISYEGGTGYISSEYIAEEKPEALVTSVSLNPSWTYAEFSKINSGTATFRQSTAENRKNITVCVNAGHGTSGGASVKTLCHPDGSPKVTSGTTAAGATTAAAVSGGMTFADGTPESQVTLSMALIFRDKLLAAGYDVLMIRESEDVQLDNVARTVIANNASDCHIALHWDSTANDKGAFYMSVPDVASYRSMEPVKSHWQQHNALGESLVAGLKGAGVKIFSSGAMAMDLTQTSFSTVPSIDIELGDKASDHSQAALERLADGLLAGVNAYFG